jgi:hypothetical protein
LLGEVLSSALEGARGRDHAARPVSVGTAALRAGSQQWNAPGADMTPSKAPASAEQAQARAERFHALYREHFDFVFRNLRRLGVPAASVDDALQDVFVVVLRRLDGFREGTHPKAWLFAIALRVAGNYRRARRAGAGPRPSSRPIGSPARSSGPSISSRAAKPRTCCMRFSTRSTMTSARCS